MKPILHIATAAIWDDGDADYRAETFDHEGFIHCSTPDQVLAVAERLFRGRRDLILLVIDPRRIAHEIRYENLEGGTELFPHVYGPIAREAVVRALPFEQPGLASLLEGIDDPEA